MINKNQAYNYGNQNRIQSAQNPLISQAHRSTNNPFPTSSPLNNRNIRPNNQVQNQNQNQNKNVNMNMNINKNSNMNRNGQIDVVGKAFLMIRSELKRRDDRIIELEKKVAELTRKINMLTNRNINNNNNNNNNFSSSMNPFGKSSTEEYNEEDDRNLINKIGRDMRPGGYSFGYMNLNGNQRSNSYVRSISQNTPNYNSDSDNIVKRFQKFDNLSHSNEDSVLTYNGVNYNSKLEVKNYLRVVKNKLDPQKFKEFIRNIKMLTTKNSSTLNRNIIVENVRIIFGEEHKDLFIRFKRIIGVRN
jgi:hypothetical protein